MIIDTPERLENDIEDYKFEAVEKEKNFTAARLRVCRDPVNETPVVFYSQELHRNFKNPDDPFGKRHVIKTFTPDNAMASADTALELKFKDAVLAHCKSIHDYSPLTDIHSNEMDLFIDDQAATYLSDIGVNVDGLDEDFTGIETVSATPFMEELAGDTARIKNHLFSLRNDMQRVKQAILDEIGVSSNNGSFEELLAAHKISESLVQQYLGLKAEIDDLELKIGQASDVVFAETKTKIRLPARISVNGLGLYPSTS